MSPIAIYSSSLALRHRIEDLAGGTADQLDPGSHPAEFPADLVLLDCADGEDVPLELAARWHAERPGPSVILIAVEGESLALAALRAGVYDIVSPEVDDDHLVALLDRALTAAQRVAAAEPVVAEVVAEPVLDKPSGRVISVVSPKGGVGKTTVSTNLAVGLARVAPKSTVLVDLDLQFGDVASGLNLDPEYDLTSAIQGPASRDTMVLKTFLTLHETGLYVICAPESPAEADNITATDIRRLLHTLASEFSYVVVDTAPGLSEHTLAAMDASTDLVLLTSMDVPGLRGMRKEVDTLRALAMLGEHPKVVINMADSRSGLSIQDIEATIGLKVDVILPESKAAPGSVNLGVPLLQSGQRDPMTTQLRRLLNTFIDPKDSAALKASAPGFDKAATRPHAVPKRASTGWFRRPKVQLS